MHESMREVGIKLWEQWAAMWNGRLELADEIIADGFWANLAAPAMVTPESLRNAAAVKRWVTAIRERYTQLDYVTVDGPYVDVGAGVICCAWFADGVYGGKATCAEDVAGAGFRKSGLDLLKFADGRIVEAWTMNNSVQLGRDPRRKAP